ncbi:hypothetical protein C1O66_03605 [Paucibacter aquatile]|uniref:DUF2726 domain-containing protein n=2 Tax=Kinneretia aquatilis TaxID=2070761 RepID=A0A2N8L1F7_9BURK|nr:hypothetical protein C1O66_03490 [Paucibacter aquatile]PND39527.1 hypothetical protein C1O66_03525 [Paucibacter aquatile]PND39529.1 hypothetical protein C1O66_03565 [Paucibacter aquatile]PND39531.1 hypothetical protein C1O66_03605 [Paucibacter aquatile]
MTLHQIAEVLWPLAVVLTVFLLVKARRRPRATGKLWKRTPLTKREQGMYFRLKNALPDRVVLAQVSFSALLDTRDRPTRATFDRKVADFVICSKAFEVAAVIELDDESHRGREHLDQRRDQLLTKAGIKVLRFKNIPDEGELLAALSEKSDAMPPC